MPDKTKSSKKKTKYKRQTLNPEFDEILEVVLFMILFVMCVVIFFLTFLNPITYSILQLSQHGCGIFIPHSWKQCKDYLIDLKFGTHN